jgi:hypothetical protein
MNSNPKLTPWGEPILESIKWTSPRHAISPWGKYTAFEVKPGVAGAAFYPHNLPGIDCPGLMAKECSNYAEAKEICDRHWAGVVATYGITPRYPDEENLDA